MSKQSLFTTWRPLVLYRESMALIRNKFRCMDPWQGKAELNSSIDNIKTDTIFLHRILISCQYQHGLLSLYTYSWFLVSIYMNSFLYTQVRHFLLVSGLLPLCTCSCFFVSVFMGSRPALLVADPELIKKISVKDFSKAPNRYVNNYVFWY